MRILLAHNSTYFPAHGGGDKSNRLLMEALAARGHEVTVVARTAGHGQEAHRQLLSDLAHRDISAVVEEPGIVRFRRNGVDVHTSTESPNLRSYFANVTQTVSPDVIVASTDDSAQIFLRTALDSNASVIYLARATIALPFGPDCAFPSEEKTDLLREADGVVGVSHYVANYIREHSGIPATHIPISLMDGGPWPQTGEFSNEFVTMINPCLVKGLDIFVRLAEAFPDVKFAGVRSWGTTERDLARLRLRPNVTVLDPVDRIDDIFERTRVLLVPSIWAEARARVVQEAMLRGIPVMASDSGGLVEAKLGVPYLLPVNLITRYRGTVDAQMVPDGEAPPQNLSPWRDALRRLISDGDHWREIANASRVAALEYSKQLTAEPFENYLLERIATKRPKAITAKPALAALSLEQKKLLALKMRAKRGGEWLVRMEGEPGDVQLVCFPYAAAGANVFRNWPGVLAVQYPGRESRNAEKFLETPDAMLDALLEFVAPRLPVRFAFFGHSMGAGIAFEFARRLAMAKKPMPEMLFVSAASGPSMRTSVHPDPTDDQLQARLEAMNPDRPAKVLKTIFPMFKADTGLYRRYVYRPGELLHIPIRAYCGLHDSFVPPGNVERWQTETTGTFSMRLFEGGHMFLENHARALIDDMQEHLYARN